jgi:WD40 repeat protein/tetratricopeptide (TPR) repeat protein
MTPSDKELQPDPPSATDATIGTKIVWEDEPSGTDKAAAPEATEVYPTPPHRATSRAGTSEYIGKYRVLGVLGSGGQATTFLVRDPDLDCRVVLKQYHSAGLSAEYYLRIEARSLARIHSPFVARCLHVERIDGKLFLIMEYVPGVRLDEYVRGEQAGFVRITEVLRDIAQGLLDVHGAGLLHRDIKPANILVRPNGTPCLVDFGFASALGSEIEQIGGTWAYMSPEQAREESLSPGSDVFGLGSVMFELLTGRPPYSGATIREQAKKAQFPLPRELNPEIPKQLETICLKAMAADPAQRYATAETLRNDLQGYLDEVRSSSLVAQQQSSTDKAASGPQQIGPNPYKGLAAFTESDAEWFYGRDAQIDRLWKAFAELHADGRDRQNCPRILPIIGPSGSGKSSLARAGLVARLKRHPLPNRQQARYLTFTPGNRPVETLATELARLATGDFAPAAKAREFERLMLDADCDETGAGLRRIVALLPDIAHCPLVLLIDQFEEVFSLCPDATQRRLFIDNLLTAAGDRAGHLSVVFTLRSDFLGETQDHQPLNQAISEWGALVPAMSIDELRDSIARPAARAGHKLDSGIIELLVAETRDREGALPLLQFALARIWEGLRSGQAPAETLRQIGGVGGALAGEAQRIYESLPEEEQLIARRAFLAMVQLGEGTKDTRRRARLADLVTSSDDLRKVHGVLSKFAEPAARLITLSAERGAGPARPPDIAEVTHEALFEHWQSLRQWIDRSRDDIRFHRRLEEAARRWDENRRPRGMLWRTPDLDLLRKLHARAAADFAVLENDFRRACERQVRRERLTKVAGVAAISVAFVVAIVFWRLAERSRNTAELAERKALSLASASSAETGVLRLRGAIAESSFDPFGLLHLARARVNAEGDATAMAATSQLWSSWRDDLGNRLVQVVGHAGPVVDLAIHPDGKLFATASLDKSAAVWDLATGKALVEGGLKHDAPVGLVAFSPDGKLLATAAHDGTVRLWPSATQFKQFLELHAAADRGAHRDRVQAIAISPESDLLATGSRDGALRLWSMPSGDLIQELETGNEQVASVSFDSSGKWFAALSCDESAVIRLRTWTRGDPKSQWRLHGFERTWQSGLAVGQISTKYGIAFRPSGSAAPMLVAVRGRGADLCMRDSQGRDADAEVFEHGNVVWAARFSPDGQFVASAGADDVCQVVHVPNVHFGGRLDRVFAGSPDPLSFANEPARIQHDGDVRAVAFSPDSRMLATASWDQTVRLYDIDARKQQLVQRGRPLQHFAKLWAVEFTSDGKYLVTASDDGTARVWDCEPELGTQLAHDGAVSGQAISPDGKRIATWSEDKTARIWSIPQGLPVGAPLMHRAAVSHAAWDPESRILATTSRDGAICIWNSEGKRLHELRSDESEPASMLRFVSPDRVLAVGIGRTPLADSRTRGTMRVWEITQPTAQSAKCRLISQSAKDYLPQEHFARAFAFDAHGKRVARVDGKEVLVCKLDAAMTQVARYAHENLVTGVVFDPRGRFLVSGGWDGAGRIFDFERDAVAQTTLDHGKGVLALALSGDGRVFVTGCEDKYLRVWNTETWELVCPPLRHTSSVYEVAVDDRGQIVAARTGDRITVWQTSTGHPLREIEIFGMAGSTSPRLTPGADALAAIRNDQTSLLMAFGRVPDDAVEMEQETQLLLGAQLDSTGRKVSPISWQAWQDLRDQLHAASSAVLAKSSPGEQMHRSRGVFFLQRGDGHAAVWHFDRLIDKRPGDFDVRLKRASAYVMMEHYEPALQDLDSLVAERPDSIETRRLLVRCCKKLKKWQEAAGHLERLAAVAPPTNPEARALMATELIEVAAELVKADGFPKALPLYRLASKLASAESTQAGDAAAVHPATIYVAQVRAAAGIARSLDLTSDEVSNSSELDKVARQAAAALEKILEAGPSESLIPLSDDSNVVELAKRHSTFEMAWSRPHVRQEIAAHRLVGTLREKLMDMSAVQNAIRRQPDLDAQTGKRALELARDVKLRVTPAEIINAARRRALSPDLPITDYETALQWLMRVPINSAEAQFERHAVSGMLLYRTRKFAAAEQQLSQALEFMPQKAWEPIYSAFAAMAAAKQGNPLPAADQLPPEYRPPRDADLLPALSAELAKILADSSENRGRTPDP